jgi:hypothetical protein
LIIVCKNSISNKQNKNNIITKGTVMSPSSRPLSTSFSDDFLPLRMLSNEDYWKGVDFSNYDPVQDYFDFSHAYQGAQDNRNDVQKRPAENPPVPVASSRSSKKNDSSPIGSSTEESGETVKKSNKKRALQHLEKDSSASDNQVIQPSNKKSLSAQLSPSQLEEEVRRLRRENQLLNQAAELRRSAAEIN